VKLDKSTVFATVEVEFNANAAIEITKGHRWKDYTRPWQ
jgi:hypothetical protein